MLLKRGLGIGFAMIGIFLFFLSVYINGQVLQGESKLSRAQGRVNTINGLFSHTPYTEDAGKIITNPIQSRINEGYGEVNYYSRFTSGLKICAIICVIIGAAVLFLSRTKRG